MSRSGPITAPDLHLEVERVGPARLADRPGAVEGVGVGEVEGRGVVPRLRHAGRAVDAAAYALDVALEGHEVADAGRLVGQHQVVVGVGDRLAPHRRGGDLQRAVEAERDDRADRQRRPGSGYAASSASTALHGRARRPNRTPSGPRCVRDALVGHVGRQAAVDHDLGAVVVRRVVRQQEHDRRSDVGRRPDAGQRDLGERRLEEGRRGRLHERACRRGLASRRSPGCPASRAPARRRGSGRAAPTSRRCTPRPRAPRPLPPSRC